MQGDKEKRLAEKNTEKKGERKKEALEANRENDMRERILSVIEWYNSDSDNNRDKLFITMECL